MFGKKEVRTIYLIRHGKAGWGDMGTTDRERKLEPQGIAESKLLGQQLMNRGIQVDLMVSSDAVRAWQTANILAETTGYPKDKIKKEPLLYLADEVRLLDELLALPDEVNTVIFVAHNPGLTDFVNQYMESPVNALPPSALVGIRFKAKHWIEIEDCHGQITETVFPLKDIN